MENQAIEELVVSLDRSMELASVESGIKLVGKALVNRNLNRWKVRNILRAAWKEFGDIEIKWVRENLFIIVVQDENTAKTILSQLPWAIMKQNFLVQRWPPNLALEEINLKMVPFWIQLHGVPLNLSSEANVSIIASKIGEVMEVEDLAIARGFLRARVVVNTLNPLPTGCWLSKEADEQTWI